jgi:hypothetical protein
VNSDEFSHLRIWLDKTQEEIGRLLGISVQAVRSYEQSWRPVPVHVERHLLFLVSRRARAQRQQKPCWIVKQCPKAVRTDCPAWEFRTGEICWFITGTHCQGAVQSDWAEKMQLCRQCEMLRPLLRPERQ